MEYIYNTSSEFKIIDMSIIFLERVKLKIVKEWDVARCGEQGYPSHMNY